MRKADEGQDAERSARSASVRVRLKKLAQRSHIDGTAALLDALCVRQKWYSEFGDRLKNVA